MSRTGNSIPNDYVEELKRAASGRWVEIFSAAGIASVLLDGKGHPCPRCGGHDRFAAFKDIMERGAVICRKCFDGNNGDGFATLMWWLGCDFPEAVRWVAEHLTMSDGCGTQPKHGNPEGNGKLKKTYPTAQAAVAALERTRGKRSGTWTYHDANSDPVGLIIRWDKPGGKDIRPVARCGDGWIIGGMAEPRPLYGLPNLDAPKRVFVTEGEKAAEAARSIGLTPATTPAHGSQSPHKTDWSPLAGKECIILPDNDGPGRNYADTVAAILAKLRPAPVVKLVELPDLPNHGDIADWLEARPDADAGELLHTVESLADEAEVIQVRAIPRERDRARIEFSPIPASQLGDGEQVDWIWHGYVALGFVTLLIGLWKAGKSTLLAYLLKAMQAGGELAGAVCPAKVVVITEEGSGLWARRRDDVGFGDHVHFEIRPFKCRPRYLDWERYIRDVATSVERGDFDLVIIDTWSAVNPCPDENDAAGMMAALSPLHSIAEAGAAILLAHHPRKGDAAEGQASRGSGALPGFVDTIIELRRFNAQEPNDRRRKLRGHSRFEETPAEVVIELTDDGYELVGSTGDANRDDRQQVIAEILTDGESRTSDEIRDQWPEGAIPKPGKRTIQRDLNHGCTAGKWKRYGKGTKGNPYRYRFDSRTPPLLSAHNESNGRSSEETCDHIDPTHWVHRDGKAFCPACKKLMGRISRKEAHLDD